MEILIFQLRKKITTYTWVLFDHQIYEGGKRSGRLHTYGHLAICFLAPENLNIATGFCFFGVTCPLVSQDGILKTLKCSRGCDTQTVGNK